MSKKKLVIPFNQLFKPECIFLILATVYGFIILFLTPPFQSPDEDNHFYRAYQISEGHFIAQKADSRLGGYLPKSLKKTVEPFLGMRWDMNVKTKPYIIRKQFGISLNSGDKEFVDFPNTAMYSFVPYLPEALAIVCLRVFNTPPMFLFYAARIFALLFWIVVIYYSIKIIPFFKWFFVLVALLPMSVFVNMSVNADVVTNALCFLLIAYIFKLYYSYRVISYKQFAIVLILAILLALSKLVYLPLIGLFLLIPRKNFLSRSDFYIKSFLLAAIAILVVFGWSKIMYSLYTPYPDYNKAFRDDITLSMRADMVLQKQFILHHPVRTIETFFNAVINPAEDTYRQYIGTLGWLDTWLPEWFILVAYFMLVFIALIDSNKQIKLQLWHRGVIVLLLGITICLILLSQYLTWSAVGSNIIAIQGRYLIPCLPLFFMLLYNTKMNFQKILLPILLLFSVISLSFTTRLLYKRYYIDPIFSTLIIYCDAEGLLDGKEYLTDQASIYLENGKTQVIEKAHSGVHSAKVTLENPFAFTYYISNCGVGDVLYLDVWRYGNSGTIIISGEGKSFTYDAIDIVEKDSTGWEHLKVYYIIPKNMGSERVGIFVHNPSKKPVYFDDITIRYNKLENW